MNSDEDKIVIKKLKCIVIISVIFMFVEIMGGILANSVAILADAFHLLSDVMAYVISLQAIHFSYKIPPKYMTFGYEKLQPLGALFNVVIIWFVTIELLMEATGRIIHKEVVQEPFYMLVTSIFGLGCNLYIMKVLHSDQQHGGCSHSHGHSHSHQHSHSHPHSHQHGHSHSNPHPPPSTQAHSHSNHQHKQGQCSHSHNHNRNHNHNHEHEQLNANAHEISLEQVADNQIIVQDDRKGSQEQIQCDMQLSPHTFMGQLQYSECNHEHSDSDSESHSHTPKFLNLNIEAAYIHIISDIILSIGVIVSATIIYFKASPHHWSYWHLADPFCTYFFSIVAIYSTIDIIKSSVIILLDGCDDKYLFEKVYMGLKRVKQIKQVSDLKVWSNNRKKYYTVLKIGVSQLDRDILPNIKASIKRVLAHYKIQNSFIDINLMAERKELKEQ